MTDVLTPEQRKRCMASIRGKDTKPEVAIRKAIWRLGYRYRISSSLPGKPDLVFRRFNTVVFIDGCFWHKCPLHFVQPKTRSDFWTKKISANAERDKIVTKKLNSQGWQVVRIWEHQIKESLENSVASLAKYLERQRVTHNSKDC